MTELEKELLEALKIISAKADELQLDVAAYAKGIKRDIMMEIICGMSHRLRGIELLAKAAIAVAKTGRGGHP